MNKQIKTLLQALKEARRERLECEYGDEDWAQISWEIRVLENELKDLAAQQGLSVIRGGG